MVCENNHILKSFSDCHDFDSDLIECFAYNLFLRNSEKFQDLNPESKQYLS